MELRGARVLITGASRGLGESLAGAFAAAGSTVALVARDADAIAALALSLGGSAHAADLSDPAQVASLIGRVEEEAGPIDVLVNNAAVVKSGDFVTSSAESLRHMTEVNYLAPAELSRQVIPRMLNRGRGHIVNISSLAGTLAMPGMVGYSASKAALAHFTAALRADLHGQPIGTTLVELGAISGGMPGAGFGPTVDAVGRLSRARLLGGATRDEVTEAVVAAVRRNRRHVRLPRHAAAAPMLVEAPRRLSEFLIRGGPRHRGA